MEYQNIHLVRAATEGYVGLKEAVGEQGAVWFRSLGFYRMLRGSHKSPSATTARSPPEQVILCPSKRQDRVARAQRWHCSGLLVCTAWNSRLEGIPGVGVPIFQETSCGGLPLVPLLRALTEDRVTCMWSASLTQVTDNCFVCLLLAEIAWRPKD